MTTARRGLERIRYWQGQTLASRDLEDQLAHDASSRWWHNRAIHDAWGVVHGLQPRIEDGEVVVDPGLAYDCFGRELILARPRRLELPKGEPEGRDWLLLLRPVSPAPAACPAVELAWLAAGPVVEPDRGVPLAGLEDGELVLDPERRQRSAPAVARPRLGSGATVRGKTDWRSWTLRRPGVVTGGLEVGIDTSAAGFERAPCYQAWLQGDLFGRLDRGLPILPLVRVVRVTASSFVFSLWLPFTPRQVQFDTGAFAASVVGRPPGLVEYARRELSVCWLGIEGRVRDREKR